MASRIMHYLIGLELLKQQPFNNENDFLVGSLLPDACQHAVYDNRSHARSHFSVALQDPHFRGVDWKAFRAKYGERISSEPLLLGYYCHLITDAVWYCRLTEKYVRCHPKKERTNYIKLGYQDFRRLNGLFINEFHMEKPSLHIPRIQMDELIPDLVSEVFDGLADDFDSAFLSSPDELELYPYDEVLDFIRESLQLCLLEMDALQNGRGFSDPAAYYVKA